MPEYRCFISQVRPGVLVTERELTMLVERDMATLGSVQAIVDVTGRTAEWIHAFSLALARMIEERVRSGTALPRSLAVPDINVNILQGSPGLPEPIHMPEGMLVYTFTE